MSVDLGVVSSEMVSRKDKSICAVDELLVKEGIISFGRRKRRQAEANLEDNVCIAKKRGSIAAVCKLCSDSRYKWVRRVRMRKRRSLESGFVKAEVRSRNRIRHFDCRSEESGSERTERLCDDRNRHKEAYRERYRKLLGLQQTWNRVCSLCGCVRLASMSEKGGKSCCCDGRGFDFMLEPLSGNIKSLIVDNVETFSRASSSYNNVFSLGATGVESVEGHGWERRRGHHSATLNGRTFHFLPSASDTTDPSGGLSYFTFDIRSSMVRHAEMVNKADTGKIYDTLKPEYLQLIYDDLGHRNRLVRDVVYAGAVIGDTDIGSSNVVSDMVAKINTKMQFLEVAQVTSDLETHNRVVTYQMKGSGRQKWVPMSSNLLEPLCYPLLFCCGDQKVAKKLSLFFSDPGFHVTIYTYLQFYHDGKLYIKHDEHSGMQFGIYTKRHWNAALHRIDPNILTGCLCPATPRSNRFTCFRIGGISYTMTGPLSFANQACVECADADFNTCTRPTDYAFCSIITATFRRYNFQPLQQIYLFYNDGQVNNRYNCHGYRCLARTQKL
jgi:hypothetical protein